MLNKLIRRHGSRDQGAAMITTLLVSVVISGMGVLVVDVAVNNLQNAGRDRLASGAMGAAEAGVAQGITYIRSQGLGRLACSPGCATNPWGNQTSPKIITLADGREARVWIERVQDFSPPAVKTGIYRVHSQGTAGKGPGLRILEQTVSVKPFEFPIGLYGDNFADAGNTGVHQESMFSRNCISKRSHLEFSGIDPWNNIPSAAHSASYITDANSCSANPATDNKRIHKVGAPCDASFPYDQDSLGAVLPLGACNPPLTTSYFDINNLTDDFNYRPRGLSNTEYAALRTKAQSMGQYYTTTAFTAPDPAVYPNAVMYFKIGAGQTVSIQKELNAYAYDTTCTNPRSLVIVIEGGSLHINSDADLTGAIFVPDGNFQNNGNSEITGTLFAKTIDKFNGTANFQLTPCFLANLPGGLMDVSPMRFREVDRL